MRGWEVLWKEKNRAEKGGPELQGTGWLRFEIG